MVKIKNSDLEYLKGVLMQYIPNSRFKAIKVKQCARLLDVNPRIIRLLVQELRDDGYPICSTPYDGYWMAQTTEEVDLTINILARQVKTLQDTMHALENSKEQIGGK